MTRRILLVALALAALAPAAEAAAPIKVIGSARATGEYAAASARGSANRPAALYVRAYGSELDVSTAMTCSRGLSVGTKSQHIAGQAVSGKLYRLALPMVRPTKCSVAAAVISAGPLRVQLLAQTR